MSSSKVCVFCRKKNSKLFDFNRDKLKKCDEILSIRKEFNLKFSQVILPESENSLEGYHSSCYQQFTALHSKYKKKEATTNERDEEVPSTSKQ